MNGDIHTEKISDLAAVLAQAMGSGSAFCVARFPGGHVPKIYTATFRDESAIQEPYFIVCPWSKTGEKPGVVRMVQINTNNPEFKKSGARISKSCMPTESTSYKDYRVHFGHYQEEFKKGLIKKSILSRVKLVEKPVGFNAARMFERLCETYPDAFVYIFSHPDHGLWMGASPELLLKKNGHLCQTVSLAGTQPSTDREVHWSRKEIEEQSMVTDHIRMALNKSGIQTFSEYGPETLDTGHVSHLKTTFRFELAPEDSNAKQLIKNLHPTPAVAGLPVEEAIGLISNTEKHQRGLYTGYLGEIGAESSIELYVNLRCMQIGKNQIALYLGGGITSSSDVQSEWEETENKAQTLLKHLYD